MITRRIALFASIALHVACSSSSSSPATNEQANDSGAPGANGDASNGAPVDGSAAGAQDGGGPADVDGATNPPTDGGTTPIVGDGAVGGELIAPVTSCDVPGIPDGGSVNTKSNVKYGSLAPIPNTSGISAQTLDIAWPTSSGLHPLVVAIHGGGWYAGSSNAEDDDAKVLASLGYVTASLNYRLVTTADGGAPSSHGATTGFLDTFPADISDVRCALRYLRAHATDYSIDPSRVAVYGTSAGAHLTSLLALAPNEASFDDGTCPSELANESLAVNVAVGFYGPYDVTDVTAFMAMPEATFDMTVINALLNGQMTTANLAHASAVTYVTASAPPMLLLHGAEDQDIPATQAPELSAALHAAGVASTVIEVPNEMHGFAAISTDAALRTSTCTFLSLLKTTLSP